jgi:hypothetical protein
MHLISSRFLLKCRLFQFCIERLIYINIFGLGLASTGLGLESQVLGLDVADLANITDYCPGY